MPSPHALGAAEVEAFHRDGYVLRKALFDAGEVALMNDVIRNDPTIREATYAPRICGVRPSRMPMTPAAEYLNDLVLRAAPHVAAATALPAV